jgi:hypothetical protein
MLNKKKLNVSVFTTWTLIREVERLLHSLITSELVASKWSASTSSRFTRWKEPRYLLNMRLYGTQKLSGRFGEEIHFLPLRGFESWIVDIVAYSLHRVNYPAFQLLNKKFHNFCVSANIICLLNKSEIGETCSTNGNYDKWLRDLSRNTWN